MEVLELQGDCWKTGHWPLGFSAPNAYVIETDSRHTQRAALHVRGPGPGPEVHTLVGTFHHGDSSCVFQRGTTERSLGKEELRSPELFLFFCGHWKCNSTKVFNQVVHCQPALWPLLRARVLLGKGPLLAMPNSCKIHYAKALFWKKENARLSGKRAAGHSPKPERLLKTMASHEDCLSPNNRETDGGRF